MSSTTIRYSGVPENSHSRGLGTDTDAYSTAPADPEPGPIPSSDDELAALLRARLRNISARDAEPGPGARPVPHTEPRSAPDTEPHSEMRSEVRSAPRTDPRTEVRSAQHTESGFVPGFIPGKAVPVSSDPRHNPAYPHPKNPGLFDEPDGFYDWAGRRLFLSDGSPDPLTPGAYRYQTRPDLCVLDASDDDPWSPRYEPDHLRHKPGDDWLIDENRPYDVLDPGTFGSPGWFPDRRTGRHRRDEPPDPIPWWEIEEDPEKAEWAEHAEALYDRRTRLTREREAREGNRRETADRGSSTPGEGVDRRSPAPGKGADRRPSTPREGPDRNKTDPPEPPLRQATVPEERPRRQPAPRPQPWVRSEAEAREALHEPAARQTRPQHQPNPQDLPHQQDLPRQADRRATGGTPEEHPHRFNKLREDAWDRFIEKSADLAAAHRSQTAIERECGPTIGRIARGLRLITGLLRHRPKPRGTDSVPPDRHSRLAEAVPADRRARLADPVPPHRHTTLADRTARFAQAMRGAQRARTEAPLSQAARGHLSGGAAWA